VPDGHLAHWQRPSVRPLTTAVVPKREKVRDVSASCSEKEVRRMPVTDSEEEAREMSVTDSERGSHEQHDRALGALAARGASPAASSSVTPTIVCARQRSAMARDGHGGECAKSGARGENAGPKGVALHSNVGVKRARHANDSRCSRL
jgi:hypothetical protein